MWHRSGGPVRQASSPFGCTLAVEVLNWTGLISGFISMESVWFPKFADKMIGIHAIGKVVAVNILSVTSLKQSQQDCIVDCSSSRYVLAFIHSKKGIDQTYMDVVRTQLIQ